MEDTYQTVPYGRKKGKPEFVWWFLCHVNNFVASMDYFQS